MNSFVLALIQLAEEDGNTAVIEQIRNQALAKIAGGEAKSLINSSVNGKSFAFNISKPADVLFAEASQAIRAFNQGTVTALEIDFRGI